MLKQFLNLKLSQKLSPQQIQLMKLIQLPTQAFEQRLLEEMNENPALEAGKEEDEYEKTSLKKTMMIMMMPKGPYGSRRH
jgi:RNA polymerase sigma-54 factor